jgi:hypothetical protein
MPRPSSRRLLPIVVAYLPVPIVGAVLSARWGVGASPGGGPRDMVLRGTALTPPVFLPVVLVAAAAAAPEPGLRGRVGAGLVALVGLAFLGGSTANLPNDFRAADAAGTPRTLTALLAAVHLALALTLLYNAVPAALGRVELKAHIDVLNKALEAHESASVARKPIEDLLKKGLWGLDTSIIKSDWI